MKRDGPLPCLSVLFGPEAVFLVINVEGGVVSGRGGGGCRGEYIQQVREQRTQATPQVFLPLPVRLPQVGRLQEQLQVHRSAMTPFNPDQWL